MPNVGDGLRTFDSGGDAMPVDVTDNGALSAPTGPRASYREDEPRALIDGSGQSSLTGTITGVGERSFIVIANACRKVTVWGSVRGTLGSRPSSSAGDSCRTRLTRRPRMQRPGAVCRKRTVSGHLTAACHLNGTNCQGGHLTGLCTHAHIAMTNSAARPSSASAWCFTGRPDTVTLINGFFIRQLYAQPLRFAKYTMPKGTR
jgi:hypothetical protein